MKLVMSIAPMKFSAKPAFDICGMLTQPLLKIIALGGVATGSMKAKDADKAAGTIR
jgi:hypothetical protein